MVVVFLWCNFLTSLSAKKDGVKLNICLAAWGQVMAHAWHCYINNTDVGVGWGRGVTRSDPILRHTEEAFVGAGATL